MPHQCTNCQETFPDGSKEMLSGCPNCGHNTFQYIPEGADPEPVADEEPPEPPIDQDSVTGKMTRAASTVKDYVRAREEDPRETTSGETTDTPSSKTPPTTAEETSTGETADDGPLEESTPESKEDRAQASARGDVADISELSSPSPSEREVSSEQSGNVEAADRSDGSPQPADGRVVEEPNVATNSDLEELRAELNDQFESIRIIEPGQYELNLMELYDREEHIVALREDGKYVIEVPETWRDAEDTDD